MLYVCIIKFCKEVLELRPNNKVQIKYYANEKQQRFKASCGLIVGARYYPPPCLVKNAFKLILMAFLLINFSQSVYSQVKGKWKVPVQCVADPNVLIESRLMEISFGVLS